MTILLTSPGIDELDQRGSSSAHVHDEHTDLPTENARDASRSAFSPSGAIHISLDVFEGPLDLLLALIERHGLAVTEISVVAVAGQFLEQIQAWQEINMTVTAEFLAMAARLLLLKSRALLPRPPQITGTDDATADDGDARDLVDRLAIYKAFVDLAAHLRTWQEDGRTSYGRLELGTLPDYLLAPPTGTAQEQQWLAQAAMRCLRRARRREDAAPRTLPPSPLDLDFQAVLNDIQRSVTAWPQGGQTFEALLPSDASVLLIVATFLALLELVRRGTVRLIQEQPFGNLRIHPTATTLSVDSATA